MNGPARVVLCSALLALSSSFALADTVSITGSVSFTPDSLTFAPPFATQTNTGIFSGFSGGMVNYLLGTVSYTNGMPQTEEAFTITDRVGNVLAFYDEVNSPVQSYDANGNLAVALNETGYYTVNGGTGMAGYFNVFFDGTSPFGSTTDVSFNGSGDLFDPTVTSITPEPASILLLGTGLLGSAVLLRRKYRLS